MAISEKTTTTRREEIVNACEKLYQTMSFKEINLKEIGLVTSFSRPTIYNYFHTKEEIFLALFEREYNRWNEELETILNKHPEAEFVQLQINYADWESTAIQSRKCYEVA